MRWRFNGEISFTYSTLQQILRRSFYRWSHKQAAAAATALLVAEKRIEIRGEKGECTVRTQTHTHIHIRICISLSLTLAHLVESHQSLLRTAFVVVFVILSVLIEHCFILQYFTYTYTHSYTYRLQSLNKACLYHFWLTLLPICCCPQIRLSLNLIRLAVCASYPYLLTGSPPPPSCQTNLPKTLNKFKFTQLRVSLFLVGCVVCQGGGVNWACGGGSQTYTQTASQGG